MARKRKQRQSGAVRRLPSGRYQARLREPATNKMVSLGTFATIGAADRALAEAQTDQNRGAWVDPRRGRVTVSDYAATWLDQRPRPLAPRTREQYEYLLRKHILPVLGDVEVGRLTVAAIRSWHSGIVAAAAPGGITPPKAYRLLRTILNTAVEDEIIARNPCTIRGAGLESSPERPVVSTTQINALADAMPPHLRTLVLIAAYVGLRLGELRGLRSLSSGLRPGFRISSECRC